MKGENNRIKEKFQGDVNFQDWENAASVDILKELGPISKEEAEYYRHLPNA